MTICPVNSLLIIGLSFGQLKPNQNHGGRLVCAGKRQYGGRVRIPVPPPLRCY